MKRCAKLLAGLFLVMAVCLSIPSFASAAETTPSAQSSAAVNGGLEAEILTAAQENNSVPVTVRITNTNTYDVTGIGYKLSATENGKLSGKTSDSNLSVAAAESITAEASLMAASGLFSPRTGDSFKLVFGLISAAVFLAIAVLLIVKKKKTRQCISMLLAVVILAGTFGAAGIPFSAFAEAEGENQISFTVTQDVNINGETVRLTLEVTLPETAGDGNHTVSFVDSENQTVRSFTVPDGGTVPAEQIPVLTKTGKSFDGWFLNPEATQPFYSDDPVEMNLLVYPGYSRLSTDQYYVPVCHDAGFVGQTHRVVISSESELTTETLANTAVLETLFGETPSVAVTPLGSNKYELSAVYSSKGSYCWKLTDEAVVFDGLDAGVREYSFTVVGEETEDYELSDELQDISAYEFISLEATSDEYVSILHVFGDSYSVGSRLGIPDGAGGKTYYRVTEIIQRAANRESGKTNWSLKVTPCAIEEVYDEIDVNQQNEEADEIIDLTNPEDIEKYTNDIENSETMRVYADYLASAVNDSQAFRREVQESYARQAYIGYQSKTMLKAKSGDLSAENAGNAIDEALELTEGIDISKPGVNISINASAPVVKTDDFNSYWDERYAMTGEMDPKTGEIVNLGKKDFFGKNFASIKTDVSVTFSLNGGTKNIAVEAKLILKQYVKVCSATQVKLEVGWEIYKGSEIHAGATAYTDTSVDFTVTLKTDNGGFDITEEIDDIVSVAKGEKYESDNQYIKRFRNLYDGTERDFVEVYRKDFCKFRFTVGPVEINIPVAFVVRFGLNAGVGIGYNYRTTYTVGVYKEKNSDKITPYRKPGEPGWEFNLYVAGHAGVKIGLNAQLGISITSCSKLFEIGLEAELGIRADFYGYFLLKTEKDRTDSGTVKENSGAYYFNTKIYFILKLYAKAFTYEKKWDLYSDEKDIYTAGNRYVLMDFNRRNEQTEPVIIPVTKESKLTKVKDGKATYNTVCFDLKTYFDSLKPVFFDLKKSNEVFNESAAKELINKYTTVTVGGCLTLPDGAVKATGNTTVHLRPSVLNALLNEEKHEIDTSITFVYNGPMFSFSDDRPSVTYKIKLVSQKYMTGKKISVRFMVDGKLYQIKQYLEGTTISPWDAYVSDEFCNSIGVRYAEFDIPVEKLTQDTVLHANCIYEKNNTVNFNQKMLTKAGLSELNSKYTDISKGYEVEYVNHRDGALAAYFLGWDLEGDGSDELNVPVPGQNSVYNYNAVYSELPEYTVTVEDKLTGEIISQKSVLLGEAYTIESCAPPDDGRRYTSILSCESGSYLSTAYGGNLAASVKIYPTSDVSLTWNHQVYKFTVNFYSDYDGTLFDTQEIEDGGYITDPLGEENWPQLDKYDENELYHEFIGWETWNKTGFAQAETVPVTDNLNVFAAYRYMTKHNITLLDEDGVTVLFSGLITRGIPLNTKYYAARLPDKENTYEFCWRSVEDGTVAEKAESSGTYKLCWEPKARKYTIAFDTQAAGLAGDRITFESGIAYGELENYIAGKLGSFVPQKQETEYETYRYDGFEMLCEANANGEYGICTVSFLFTAVPKKCTVTLIVRDSADKTGTLWLGQEQLTLQNEAYSFDFTLSETKTGLEASYMVVPDDRNFNFTGWSANGVKYSSGETVSLLGLDTITLTAVYERKPFAVILDSNGEAAGGEQTVYANLNEQIQLPSFPKESDAQYTYEFDGWQDGSGNRYTENYQVTGNAVLTPEYVNNLRSYYITFNANGGAFSDGKESIDVLTEYGAVPSPESPQRQDSETERYTFDGWTTGLVKVTGVAEYTAKWKVTKLYTLTFNAGDGQFDAQGTNQKKYVLEEGETFSPAAVSVPYYNYNGEVRRFIEWSVTDESITVTENAEFAAVWSEPVSSIGILVSNGENSEDVAAFLAGAEKVSGYSLEYNAGEEGVLPFFTLKITGGGLTLSGNGTLDYAEVYGVNVTLKNLTMISSVTAFGKCEFTIDGNVNLRSVNGTTVMLANLPDSPVETPENALSFTGKDNNSKLIVESSDPGGAIRSFGGIITMTGLTAEITANEVIDYNTPVALGANDVNANAGSFNVCMIDSNVFIHKGYLSGKVKLENSRVEFDDNEYTGIFSANFNYSENPVLPDSIISLENSVMLFRTRAYIDISYSCNPNVYYSFNKKTGEDEFGNPLIGWFTTQQELENELNSSSGAWMLNIGEGSSIQISE